MASPLRRRIVAASSPADLGQGRTIENRLRIIRKPLPTTQAAVATAPGSSQRA